MCGRQGVSDLLLGAFSRPEGFREGGVIAHSFSSLPAAALRVTI
jgi:hypothetical protein